MKTNGLLRKWRLAAASLLLLSVPLVSSMKAADQEAIETTRAKIEKWIETKRLISQEERDLELAKEMLTERIKLVQHEIDSLNGKVDDAKASIAEADGKRAGMLQENQELKDASTSLMQSLETLEDRTKKLLKRLPDPICERVRPLQQKLPEKSGETKLSTSERFQNVVGILNEVDKFNREITLTSEVRTLTDKSAVEVVAVYIGIGQAFYSSADGTVAGIGTAEQDKWVWKPQNSANLQIVEAIAILKNEKVAAFVRLPVEIN